MNLKDKVVWVTGASSGIWKALAEALIKTGCSLIITARNETELLAIKNQSPHPEKVMVLTHDISDYKNAADKVNKVIEIFGKVDIMIHNAGISQRSLAIDTDIEVDRKLMETNYLGTVALTKALLPHFVKQHSGHFAVITSLTGKFGSPLRSGYAASKHALHGYFDSLRAEHTKDNIQVTLICPGYVVTNVSKNALTGDGSPQQKMDNATAHGVSAGYTAKKILKAIESKKLEVYIGKKEVLAIYLKRFFPSLFAKVLEKAKVT
jgi:dehydrogenase/reductase SDR family member 7B